MADYKVLNPYGQPEGEPVLTGVRKDELKSVIEPNDRGERVIRDTVDYDWYEGETIPGEKLSELQKSYWLRIGVIEEV